MLAHKKRLVMAGYRAEMDRDDIVPSYSGIPSYLSPDIPLYSGIPLYPGIPSFPSIPLYPGILLYPGFDLQRAIFSMRRLRDERNWSLIVTGRAWDVLAVT